MADIETAWTRLEAAARAAGERRIVEMFEANMADPIENQPSDLPARKYSSLVVFF